MEDGDLGDTEGGNIRDAVRSPIAKRIPKKEKKGGARQGDDDGDDIGSSEAEGSDSEDEGIQPQEDLVRVFVQIIGLLWCSYLTCATEARHQTIRKGQTSEYSIKVIRGSHLTR